MSELSYGPLMRYDRVDGFLCDWHIAGPFDSGLTVDPNVVRFQQKLSSHWEEDHLAPWGGCQGISVPLQPLPGLAWNWDLLPVTCRPKLSLKTGAQEFPAWQERMKGLDPDAWSKLYYAMAVVDSPVESEAELVFGGWDGCRLWINGQARFDEHSYHHVVYDMERVKFPLKRGLNTFLFQLDRDGVVARIELPAGESAALGRLRSVAFGPAPEPRRVATLVQLRRHAMQQSIRMPFTGATPDDLRLWQEQFGAHYRRCLGDAPVSTLRPDSAALVGRKQCDGYEERLYHVPTMGDCLLPCYVLVPDKGRFNGRALVTVHGHTDYRRLLGYWPQPDGNQNYTQRMAQKGFLCALTCQPAFSDRRDDLAPGDPCNNAAMMALAQGLVLARLHIADLQVLTDLLMTMPGVDAKRIGITGLSGGGSLTYLTAAYDRRFAAAAEFCSLCRYSEYATGPNGCGMQVVPGLFPTGDSGEILSLIAPRPLLLGQGRLDSTFHTLGVRSIAEDARRAYKAAGAEDRLEVSIFELAHEFHPDIAEQFFLKWL